MKTTIVLMVIVAIAFAISGCTPAQRAAVETGWESYEILVPLERGVK